MKSSSKDASTNQEITQLEAEKNSIETKLDKLSTQKNVKASEQKDLLTRMEQLLEKAEKVAGTLEE
jgi:chromosome segregation ATPase